MSKVLHAQTISKHFSHPLIDFAKTLPYPATCMELSVSTYPHSGDKTILSIHSTATKPPVLPKPWEKTKEWTFSEGEDKRARWSRFSNGNAEIHICTKLE